MTDSKRTDGDVCGAQDSAHVRPPSAPERACPGANTRLLTPSDVAERLGLSSPRAALIHMHRMPHHRIGKHLRVTEQALRAYLAKTEVTPREAPADVPRSHMVPRPGAAPVPSVSGSRGGPSEVPTIRPTQARRRKSTGRQGGGR